MCFPSAWENYSTSSPISPPTGTSIATSCEYNPVCSTFLKSPNSRTAEVSWGKCTIWCLGGEEGMFGSLRCTEVVPEKGRRTEGREVDKAGKRNDLAGRRQWWEDCIVYCVFGFGRKDEEAGGLLSVVRCKLEPAGKLTSSFLWKRTCYRAPTASKVG